MVGSGQVSQREVERRERRLRTAIAAQITELRHEAGLTQSALSRAAGLAQGHLSRIESGQGGVSLGALAAIGIALGADLGVRFFPGAAPRVRDHLQAAMLEALLRLIHPSWVATPELPVPTVRGVIDLALRRPGLGGVACEAHSQLRSVDLIQRRVREKTLALADVAGYGPEVSAMLLVRSTAINRDIVRLHAATFGASFPARTRDALDALRSPSLPWPGAALVWATVEGGQARILEGPARLVPVGR